MDVLDGLRRLVHNLGTSWYGSIRKVFIEILRGHVSLRYTDPKLQYGSKMNSYSLWIDAAGQSKAQLENALGHDSTINILLPEETVRREYNDQHVEL